jgi:hypothetical protein
MYVSDGKKWKNRSEFEGMSKRSHQSSIITPECVSEGSYPERETLGFVACKP